MPQKDIYHNAVVNALITDGWTITDDPLRLTYGGQNFYVDLGAEQPIGAEKQGVKIAVEIKSFLSASSVHDLEIAIGQYNLYRDVLAETEPDRLLYLAVPLHVYADIFEYPLGLLVTRRQRLRLVAFDEEQEKIALWTPPITEK